MYNLEIKFDKDKNMANAIQRFIDAQDHETIILHMKNPVELERIVFNEKYLKL